MEMREGLWVSRKRGGLAHLVRIVHSYAGEAGRISHRLLCHCGAQAWGTEYTPASPEHQRCARCAKAEEKKG